MTFADAHRATQGQGVVDFATEEEMKTAIEKLDDTEFRGKRITVREVSDIHQIKMI